jgi:hypothetical protein
VDLSLTFGFILELVHLAGVLRGCLAHLLLDLSALLLIGSGAHLLVHRGAHTFPLGALLHAGRGAFFLVERAALLVLRGATGLIIHRTAHLHKYIHIYRHAVYVDSKAVSTKSYEAGN